jgi:hypothetical protein
VHSDFPNAPYYPSCPTTPAWLPPEIVLISVSESEPTIFTTERLYSSVLHWHCSGRRSLRYSWVQTGVWECLQCNTCTVPLLTQLLAGYVVDNCGCFAAAGRQNRRVVWMGVWSHVFHPQLRPAEIGTCERGLTEWTVVRFPEGERDFLVFKSS